MARTRKAPAGESPPGAVMACTRARGLGLAFALSFLASLAPAGAAIGINLQQLPGATGLSSPVAIVDAGDGSGRLFIVEQAGLIRIWQNGALLATPFLSIPAANIALDHELGLLGLAFHPDFADNGYFFVNYTEPEPVNPPSCPPGAGCNQNTVIARFRVQSKVDPDSGNPNLADYSTEVRLLRFNQPHTNHNGGELHFGADGYLYIATGDGGGGATPTTTARTSRRCSARSCASTSMRRRRRVTALRRRAQAYAAAPGNPSSAPRSRVRRGLAPRPAQPVPHQLRPLERRHLHRRRRAGDARGDRLPPVGAAGVANWGWRCYEGSNPLPTDCSPSGTDFPIHDYTHSSGRCSVTGGYRYRGSVYGNLYGVYLFADHCTGEIWSLTQDGGGLGRTRARTQRASRSPRSARTQRRALRRRLQHRSDLPRARDHRYADPRRPRRGREHLPGLRRRRARRPGPTRRPEP